MARAHEEDWQPGDVARCADTLGKAFEGTVIDRTKYSLLLDVSGTPTWVPTSLVRERVPKNRRQ